MFGAAVRSFVEIGPPEERVGQTGLLALADRPSPRRPRGTLTRDPGPVHLNVSLREPLVPGPGDPGTVDPGTVVRHGGTG